MTLHLRITTVAANQVELADAWWRENRQAVPGALRDDLDAAFKLLLRQPGIGVRIAKCAAEGGAPPAPRTHPLLRVLPCQWRRVGCPLGLAYEPRARASDMKRPAPEVSASAAAWSIPVAETVTASDSTLSVDLSDGQALSVPLAWYPRLADASPADWKRWRLVGRGAGIHWEDLDKYISVEGVLAHGGRGHVLH